MNHYTMEQLQPGMAEEFTVTVTEEMMAQFCAMSGDVSPIHMDAEYAAGRGIPAGWCTACWARPFSPPWRGSICRVNTVCSTVWRPSLPSPYLSGIP